MGLDAEMGIVMEMGMGLRMGVRMGIEMEMERGRKAAARMAALGAVVTLKTKGLLWSRWSSGSLSSRKAQLSP